MQSRALASVEQDYTKDCGDGRARGGVKYLGLAFQRWWHPSAVSLSKPHTHSFSTSKEVHEVIHIQVSWHISRSFFTHLIRVWQQVERLGVERSRAAAANADIVIMVVDAQVSQVLSHELKSISSPVLAFFVKRECLNSLRSRFRGHGFLLHPFEIKGLHKSQRNVMSNL
eukprot:1154470-Pelagomonas_calceolata.AAC.2